jgi:hypothetical protein
MPRWIIHIGKDASQRKGRPWEEISQEIERLCYQKTHIKWKTLQEEEISKTV